MDKGMWQTIMSFDLIHASYMWMQTVLFCGKHCQTMQTGTVRFCRRSWGFKIYIRWNIAFFFLEDIHLFQSVGCVRNKLQFRTAQQNQKSFLWMQDWGWMVYPHLIHGIWSSQFLETRIRVMLEWRDPFVSSSEICSPVCRDKNHVQRQSRGMFNVLNNVDLVPSNVQSSHQEALVYVFEDNEAVIKMIIKGRSPTMRHVSRTHRVALNWSSDRINLDPKIHIKYIDTKNQLAGILTKGNFTRDEWNHLLCLFNISHFSLINSLWSDVEKNTRR